MQRGDDRTGEQKSGEVIKGESETAIKFANFKSRTLDFFAHSYLRNGKHITVFLPSYKNCATIILRTGFNIFIDKEETESSGTRLRKRRMSAGRGEERQYERTEKQGILATSKAGWADTRGSLPTRE